MRNRLLISAAILVVAVLGGVVAGNLLFSPKAAETTTPHPSPAVTRDGETGVINVVASTLVWGSIVQEIGGDWVNVTVLIDDANKDPHSYEASARDQLAIKDADLVIMNGGGYDDFVLTLLGNQMNDKTVISAIESANFVGNEHVWYDFSEVGLMAERIAASINDLRPESFADITNNFDAFSLEMSNLQIRLEALREKALGLGVISTEPVGDLLLADAGFTLMTPQGLSDAVEEEREVSPADLQQASELLAGQVAVLLVTNAQTSDAVSQALTKVSEIAGTSRVQLYEGLPEATTYLDYMNAVVDHLQEAIY